MFRQNLFSRSWPKSPSLTSRSVPASPGTPTNPVNHLSANSIPEDDVSPCTPIPPRPPLFTTPSRQDPAPQSLGWTSQAAAYDVNPKYTTANQSYTHRRRKSSMITNLISGSDDPYQPTYRDWRDYVQTPRSGCGSPRGSFALNSGIAYSGTARKRTCIRFGFLVLFLSSVVLCMFWVLGGAMPLVSVPTSEFGGTFAGDVWTRGIGSMDWRSWKTQGSSGGNWKPYENIEKVRHILPKSWTFDLGFGEVLRRRDDPRNAENLRATEGTITKQATFNSDLASFGAGTLERVTTRVVPTASIGVNQVITVNDQVVERVAPSKKNENDEGKEGKGATHMGVGPTIQVREEARDEQSDISAVPSRKENSETVDDEIGKAAHRSRVRDLWKKHGDFLTDPNELGTKSAAGGPEEVAGTVADGVSPSTVTLSEKT